MKAEVVVVVSLFIHPGQEGPFRQFEAHAAQIMRTYGGRVERVIRPLVAVHGGALPHEIHIATFPSLERFEAYRGDGRLAELAPLRQSAIAKTEIAIGHEGEPYASGVPS